jgi:L-seryl-tRNA(Ser) seleniumtransferase
MGKENPYRELPSVDKVLADERLQALADGATEELTDIVRAIISLARDSIAEGNPAPSIEQIVAEAVDTAKDVFLPAPVRVINATGVIIHTNLGRAPLSDDAIKAMESVARGYCNLEFDLEAGQRGTRTTHLEGVLVGLGDVDSSDDGIAVNNNAAALLLVLLTHCWDRDVIISRGQAVEIGGGFRIPDIMRQSGARLVEVGTTNRTYLRDYEDAITENTAAIMRIHASNFRIVGFAESASIKDMARLAHEHGLLLIDDIGSGCLLDTRPFGLAYEPTVQESATAGADLTLFSGDKLLGGPQAGIIIGRHELIEPLRRHVLMRALRPDKTTIAGLHATFLHYLRGEATEKIPVWRMISMPIAEIERRARRLAKAIGKPAKVIDGESTIGGGSLPGETIPTKLVAIPGEGGYVTEAAKRLRTGSPPVVARVERDALLLDPRTVMPGEDEALLEAVRAALAA